MNSSKPPEDAPKPPDRQSCQRILERMGYGAMLFVGWKRTENPNVWRGLILFRIYQAGGNVGADVSVVDAELERNPHAQQVIDMMQAKFEAAIESGFDYLMKALIA